MPFAISWLRIGASDVTLRAERLGHVAGAMRARPELGHGAKVFLLGERQPIEPHAEKTLIERGHRDARRAFDVLAG